MTKAQQQQQQLVLENEFRHNMSQHLLYALCKCLEYADESQPYYTACIQIDNSGPGSTSFHITSAPVEDDCVEYNHAFHFELTFFRKMDMGMYYEYMNCIHCAIGECEKLIQAKRKAEQEKTAALDKLKNSLTKEELQLLNININKIELE